MFSRTVITFLVVPLILVAFAGPAQARHEDPADGPSQLDRLLDDAPGPIDEQPAVVDEGSAVGEDGSSYSTDALTHGLTVLGVGALAAAVGGATATLATGVWIMTMGAFVMSAASCCSTPKWMTTGGTGMLMATPFVLPLLALLPALVTASGLFLFSDAGPFAIVGSAIVVTLAFVTVLPAAFMMTAFGMANYAASGSPLPSTSPMMVLGLMGGTLVGGTLMGTAAATAVAGGLATGAGFLADEAVLGDLE